MQAEDPSEPFVLLTDIATIVITKTLLLSVDPPRSFVLLTDLATSVVTEKGTLPLHFFRYTTIMARRPNSRVALHCELLWTV